MSLSPSLVTHLKKMLAASQAEDRRCDCTIFESCRRCDGTLISQDTQVLFACLSLATTTEKRLHAWHEVVTGQPRQCQRCRLIEGEAGTPDKCAA